MNPKYEPLPVHAEKETSPANSGKRPIPRAIWILLFIASFMFIASGVFLTAALATQPLDIRLRSDPRHARYTCGSSTEEARKRGCTFDILSMNWLPSQCARDQTEEFIGYATNETWVYYRDRHAKSLIENSEELSELDSQFWWSTQREHMVHCAFMIMRLHKVLERDGRIDRLTGSFSHTKHCLMMLLDASKADPANDVVNTPGNIALGSC
ncbi:hypothetical protein FE257_008201 [Aspergillus nanangensis]|uniref:Uncharacterized protein n=1 Tax=Aspergillus nanangensis TaxID=2582783 RepID=A0AAD4CM24_ASPNN|nr:hypothetical protein FE257_008201 [Aspergillus nanangensis]